jgi:hypothetical protein
MTCRRKGTEMSRALVIVNSQAVRDKIATWAKNVPWNTRVEFRAPKRTLPQNDKLWACLSDVSQQVEWYGQKLNATDWKDMFTASLRKARVVPGIDPGSFVLLGLHTSTMDKEEMSNLIELIHAFGAERGVIFAESREMAA